MLQVMEAMAALLTPMIIMELLLQVVCLLSLIMALVRLGLHQIVV